MKKNHSRCRLCWGKGYVVKQEMSRWGNSTVRVFCSCMMGRLLARLERVHAKN